MFWSCLVPLVYLLVHPSPLTLKVAKLKENVIETNSNIYKKQKRNTMIINLCPNLIFHLLNHHFACKEKKNP
jgi:hypothetical protein